MARTIRVSDIGDYASQQMEKLLRTLRCLKLS
jgi:hypothetical protein